MVMKTRNHSNLPKTVKYLLETIFAITGGEFLPEGVGQISGFYLVAYMTGLILSQHDFTMTGMSYLLKLCLHDSFCRVLRITEFSSSVLLRFFVGCINRIRKTPGWVCIDDTMIAKRFSKCISYASYAFSGNYGKVIMGVHIVVFIWTDGRRRLPLGFKIWKSKKFYQDAEDYKTKSDLALELLSECLDFVRTCDYICFDSWYCSRKCLLAMKQSGLRVISRIAKNRNIVFKGKKMKASDFKEGQAGIVYLPKFGEVLLICCRIHKQLRYLISTDVSLGFSEVKKRYKQRWPIESFFRFTKQKLGLERCQCRTESAVRNHIILVFIACVCMEFMAEWDEISVYAVKQNILKEFHGLNDKFPSLKERRKFIEHVA
jgi:SRSO17 transposase